MSAGTRAEGATAAFHPEPIDPPEPRARLFAMGDYTRAIAVRAFAALGVADALGPAPRALDEIAGACAVHPAALGRLLRALAGAGLVAEPEADRFAITALSEALRSDHPFSMREAYALAPLEVSAWAGLERCLQTGRSAFEHVHGVDHRQYRAQHLEEDARMDRVHRASTRVEAAALTRLYDWSSARTVVDVGGGTGMFLSILLNAYKELRGVLFDLPRMIARVGSFSDSLSADLAGRCQLVGGDFFESVPEGGDLYVLKAVVGGWNDESVVRILRTVRAAMGPESRALVIEPVLDFNAGFTMGNRIQLQTMLLYGGPERTLDDYGRLFASADLAIASVIRRATMPILELRPV